MQAQTLLHVTLAGRCSGRLATMGLAPRAASAGGGGGGGAGGGGGWRSER